MDTVYSLKDQVKDLRQVCLVSPSVQYYLHDEESEERGNGMITLFFW